MTRLRRTTRGFLGGPRVCILVGVALLVAALYSPAAGRAQSQSYGELARFGEGSPGEGIKGSGQINDEETRFGQGERLSSHLIGVDPTDNSVYLLDEPKQYSQFKKEPKEEKEIKKRKAEEKECEEETLIEEPPEPREENEFHECLEALGREGAITRHFRLQKFTANGSGEYRVVASAQFDEEAPVGRSGLGPRMQVDGIAVDPRRKRLYVLAIDDREGGSGIDEFSSESAGASGGNDLPVASTLFAFSTEEKGSELVPAGKDGTAVLTGPGEGELEAQSKTPGKALLEPTGITVDPESEDIIIVAHEDPGKEVKRFEDQLYNNTQGESPDHFVVQRISPTGEVVPGAQGRYVDTENFFKSTEGAYDAPNSPVVVGAEGAEQLYVEYEPGIVALPLEFASKTPPRYVYRTPTGNKGAAGGSINSGWQFFPSEGRPAGGVLAVSPYGSEGNILYASTKVTNEQPTIGGSDYASLMAVSSGGSVIGWSGAQNINAPRSEGEPRYDCALNPAEHEFYTPVAAGSEGKLFVLAPEFIEKAMREAWGEEEETYKGPAYPAVIEFGPGGSGCPQATPGVLTAEVPGKPGQPLEGGTVAAGEPVGFSSYVNQGDALKVEWDFGDGSTETVSDQFRCPPSVPAQYQEYVRLEYVRQCPSVSHAFARTGALTVTERIYTDDLSTATVTQTTTVNVSGGSSGPTAVLTGPLAGALGQPATFDGKASFDSGGPNQIREYHWVFGDGQTSTTTQPTTSHTYARLGLYTVSLTVTDASGRTSPPATLPSPVAVEESSPAGGSLSSASQSGVSVPPPVASTGASTSNRPRSRPVPDVRLENASLTVGPGGQVALALSCPADETRCLGQLALRALVANSAHGGKRLRAAMTTLANGSFALAGGRAKRVVVRLTAKARALIAHLHRLSAKLTILAHDPAGAKHTTGVTVVVRTPASKHVKR